MNQNEIWTTSTGEKIAVKDMTEEHAKSALNLLLRKMREAKEHENKVNEFLEKIHQQDQLSTKGASQ
jgi:hypothetical protein